MAVWIIDENGKLEIKKMGLDESISIYHVGNDRLMELIMSYVYRKNRKSHI